ncbi:hypothetical protein ACHAXA_010366 [Cyclostephanos tholiformis]|uniref:BHLH domain-containing protein n=1 Tax=Cyclostephanos tholiformis TaxID=382380 RepID=A0ABD3RV24_9STRA
MKTNRSLAAAHTASIGDRDMMTFLPGGDAGHANSSAATGAENDDRACGTAGGGASSSAYDDNVDVDVDVDVDASSNAMDDDAFNASLDALLGDASCYDATLVASAVAAVEEVAAPSHGRGGRGGGRKRKSTTAPSTYELPPSRRTNLPCPDSACAPPSSPQVAEESLSDVIILGREVVPEQQRHGHKRRGGGSNAHPTSPSRGVHFSARGMVQLPPMFASRGTTTSSGEGKKVEGGGALPGRVDATSLPPDRQVASMISVPPSLPLPSPLPQAPSPKQPPPTTPTSSGVGSLMSRAAEAGTITSLQLSSSQYSRDRRRQRANVDVDASSFPPIPPPPSMSSMSSDPWDAFRTRFENNSVVDAPAPSSYVTSAAALGTGTIAIPSAPRPPQSSSGARSRDLAAGRASSPSSSSSSAAAAAAATMNPSSNGPQSRTMSCPPPKSSDYVTGVSEDEFDRRNRRSERNLREQERSHKITERIIELRSVLSEAGVRFKPDRYSTLVSVANYIRALQVRSASLDEEHRRLLETVEKASTLAACAGVPVLQTHPKMGGGVGGGRASLRSDDDDPASSSVRSASTGSDEEFLSFVRGIDYRTVFASCAAALSIASVDGRFVDCNEEFLRITDYTRDELLGDGPRRKCALPHPQPGPLTFAATVSTSASHGARSSLRKAGNNDSDDSRQNPVRGGGATADDDGRVGPPPEVQVRSRQHLSLFNLLGGEDMETVYAAMSRMLRAPEVPLSAPPSSADCGGGASSSSSSGDSFVRSDLTRSTAEESSSGNDASNGEGRLDHGKGGADANASGAHSGDHWTGRVRHTRRKNQVLQLNISLVRTADGRPKFFNCALSEVEEDLSGGI